MRLLATAALLLSVLSPALAQAGRPAVQQFARQGQPGAQVESRSLATGTAGRAPAKSYASSGHIIIEVNGRGMTRLAPSGKGAHATARSPGFQRMAYAGARLRR